jgi:hypothetical protein
MNDLAETKPPKIDFKNAITAAEQIMLQLPQLDLPIRHHFVNGIYAREMFIAAGTVLTGAIHKTQHLCIVAEGSIHVEDEHGHKLLKAPAVFVSKPGDKRIGLAIENTTFITIHATDKTDITELESELVAATYAEYENFIALQTEELKRLEGDV